MLTLRRHSEPREDGFTLIELLVVILIIGILSSVAIPAFMNQRKSAGEASVKADLSNAAKVFETELISKKTYPSILPASVKKSDGVSITVKGAAPASTSFSDPINPATDANIKLRTKDNGTNVTLYGRIVGNQFKMSNASPAVTKNYIHDFTYTYNCSGRIVTSGINEDTITPGTGWGTSFTMSTCRVGETLDSVTLNDFSNSYPTAYIAETAIISKASAAGNEDGFCIEGTHSSDSANVWKYDSKNGGLKQGVC